MDMYKRITSKYVSANEAGFLSSLCNSEEIESLGPTLIGLIFLSTIARLYCLADDLFEIPSGSDRKATASTFPRLIGPELISLKKSSDFDILPLPQPRSVEKIVNVGVQGPSIQVFTRPSRIWKNLQHGLYGPRMKVMMASCHPCALSSGISST
jgi:hypothetical protein